MYIVVLINDDLKSKPEEGEKKMKSLDLLAAVLLVVGGLNWGLVGLLNFDLVAAVFGSMSALSRVVYIVVGLAGIYQALQWRAIQQRWMPARVTA